MQLFYSLDAVNVNFAFDYSFNLIERELLISAVNVEFSMSGIIWVSVPILNFDSLTPPHA